MKKGRLEFVIEMLGPLEYTRWNKMEEERKENVTMIGTGGQSGVG